MFLVDVVKLVLLYYQLMIQLTSLGLLDSLSIKNKKWVKKPNKCVQTELTRGLAAPKSADTSVMFDKGPLFQGNIPTKINTWKE